MATTPTFIINIEKRTERKQHCFRQFKNKEEFAFQVVKAVESQNGALGLWQTILHIIRDLVPKNADYILICEDDHQFTKKYSADKLILNIEKAKKKDADVLLGGVSWFSDVLQVDRNLFWVDQFTGTQFIVIFKEFYQKILDASFEKEDTADRKICALTQNKFLLYPFISIQKEFGYSDATQFNNEQGYVTEIFERSDQVLSNIVKVGGFYKNLT